MIKKPANGMRDILPKEMELRTKVLNIVRETYRSFGFTEMETPCVESLENLSSKQGGENEKLIFKIMKRGDKLQIADGKTENDLADLGLRYDLTLPLSRYFSNHENELKKPFKALQIGPVWRAERPQKGRFRQFYQCDIDIFGDASNLCETELILATSTAVSKIGFKNFVIRVNDRRILKALAEKTGIEESRYDELFIALDKLDKIGEEGVLNELLQMGITEENAKSFLNLPKNLEDLTMVDPAVVSNLKEIMDTVNEVKNGDFTLEFDPTLVRGMGYYTGPIFEIAAPEFGSSIGGGGRYDEMVGKFLGQSVPAVGFSIGFERIISILLEKEFAFESDREKIVFLLEKNLSAEKKSNALKEAMELRKEGKIVLIEQMIKNKKFQKTQLEDAGYKDIREIYEKPLE